MSLALTPRQKWLVRESFESVCEYSTAVAELFYGRLFELAPQTRNLFAIEIRTQARKLNETLRSVVDALDRFDELRPQLLELGRKHAEYRVQPQHYDMLVAALTWAFAQALGGAFSRETRTAWEQLLNAVSAVMLEGAER